MDDTFALVLDTYVIADWQAAAGLLREVAGLSALYANQQARKPHGFLAMNLSNATAQQLREACAGRGIGVRVVPQSDVIPALKPLRVHQLRIADDALCVRTNELDDETRFCWDAIRLIAGSTATRTEKFHKWPTERRGTPIRTMDITAYSESFDETFADIYAFERDRQIIGARLMSRELNYAEALRDLVTSDAMIDFNMRVDGFPLLLSIIISRSPRVYVRPDSMARDDSIASTPGVTTPEDFDASNRWLLQRLRLQEPWTSAPLR